MREAVGGGSAEEMGNGGVTDGGIGWSGRREEVGEGEVGGGGEVVGEEGW